MTFLPSEILIEIFSNLEYFDLKCSIKLVCRRFRDIVNAAAASHRGRIASALFVECANTLLDGLDQPSPVDASIHPCCSLLVCRPAPDPSVRSFYNYQFPIGASDYGFLNRAGDFIPITETSIVDETAFSPAFGRCFWAMEWEYGPTSASQNVPMSWFKRQTPTRAATVLDLVSGFDEGFRNGSVYSPKAVFERGIRIFKKIEAWSYIVPTARAAVGGVTFTVAATEYNAGEAKWNWCGSLSV